MKLKHTDIKWRKRRVLFGDTACDRDAIVYFRGEFKPDAVIAVSIHDSILVQDIRRGATLVLSKEAFGKKPLYRWSHSSPGILIEIYMPHAISNM